MNCRALHFVLKVGNLKKNVQFFRDHLGMTVLRHEVFDKGCEAACNGPYDGKWSKTMIGYGPEDDHFVLELTYNYSIGSYKLGNDLQYIKILLDDTLYPKVVTDAALNQIHSPDGYKFMLDKGRKNTISEVCLASTDLDRSGSYWINILKMKQIGHITDKSLSLSYDEAQATLVLSRIDESIDKKTAFGRIAFSCPSDQLKLIESKVECANFKILTPYLSLDTPGKASVQVVILADPDGHEICFVGDEGFRELSQVDSNANDLIEKSMAEDKSDEWYEKKDKLKDVA